MRNDRHRIVVEAIEAGKTLTEAGALIGVGRQRAHQIAKLYGVASKNHHRYAAAEIAQTLALYKRDMPINMIGCVLKRRSPRRLLRRLGVHVVEPRNYQAVPWSDDDIAHLKSGRKKGLAFSILAKELGRSIGSVLGKAKRLGLCNATGYVFHRDERGWIVPGPGTKALKMYHLLVRGKTTAQIAKSCRIDVGHAYSVIERIKHPERVQARQVKYWRKRHAQSGTT